MPGSLLPALGGRQEVLARLRASIRTMERGAPELQAVDDPQTRGGWTLGVREFDRRLGGGLDPASLHEVKTVPRGAGTTAGDWAAALGFALRLTARRLECLTGAQSAPAPVLWCWSSQFAREFGAPYGGGLAALGFAPSDWLFVETARASEALWAMEEGLRSQSLALVIGVISEVELTPARRLSLAAAEHATPCLLVTDPRLSPAGSTATRWRIEACSSGRHPFNASAPGAQRYGVVLERCRHRPMTHEHHPLWLEWSDETHRFHMAAALADRASEARAAGARSR